MDIDGNMALRLYKEAAEDGIAIGHFHQGYLHEFGIGASYNLSSAYKCYMRATKSGYTNAKKGILRICEKVLLSNSPIGRWPSKSVFDYDWYCDIKDRAIAGEPEYQYLYGLSFEEGAVSNQSYEDAMAWYLRSCKAGISRSMIRLGRMYYSGIGVEKSYAIAKEYF